MRKKANVIYLLLLLRDIPISNRPPVLSRFCSKHRWNVKRADEELLLLTNELHCSVGTLLLNCLYQNTNVLSQGSAIL